MRRGLSATALKGIAAAGMLADHLYTFFPGVFPAWIHPATRFVAPIFAFFVVEGYAHTSDRTRYGLRLWTGAAGMLLLRAALEYGAGIVIRNNILYTLALGYTAVCCAERGKRDGGAWYALSLLFVFAGALTAEGGMSVLPFMLLCAMTRGRPRERACGALVWGALLCVAETFAALQQGLPVLPTLMRRSDFLFPAALPLLALYNGERGGGRSAKWGFYLFYPAHIAVLALASGL